MIDRLNQLIASEFVLSKRSFYLFLIEVGGLQQGFFKDLFRLQRVLMMTYIALSVEFNKNLNKF